MLFCNRKIIFDHFCYRYFSACMFQNASFVFINTKSCSKIWLCLRNQMEFNHFFVKYQRKSIIFIEKQPKRCRIPTNATPFWYECDTWTGKKCPFFRKNSLYLQNERSNRNNAKDWISPNHHRGVCTHIRYYLGICHDTWVQDVSWESLEGSL